MPLPRFRIRTLMIAVVVVAGMLTASVFYLRSRACAAREMAHEAAGSIVSNSEIVRYHFAMAGKYWSAAHRPWLPVPPDPPEPK